MYRLRGEDLPPKLQKDYSSLSGLKTAVQKVACINGDIIYNDGFDMYDRHQDTYEFKSFDVIDLDKNKAVLKGYYNLSNYFGEDCYAMFKGEGEKYSVCWYTPMPNINKPLIIEDAEYIIVEVKGNNLVGKKGFTTLKPLSNYANMESAVLNIALNVVSKINKPIKSILVGNGVTCYLRKSIFEGAEKEYDLLIGVEPNEDLFWLTDINGLEDELEF